MESIVDIYHYLKVQDLNLNRLETYLALVTKLLDPDPMKEIDEKFEHINK